MFVSETKLIASITKESYYEFLKEFWDSIVSEPFIDNWHVKYCCDEFQKCAERVFAGKESPYDLIVNMPPGESKSSIYSVFNVPWVWTNMPKAKFICGSHTADLVRDLGRKSRDILNSPRQDKPAYYDCFPELQLRDDQNTKEYFMNTKGGWRKAATVGGKSPVGFHAHFLVVDDPIDPQKAVTLAGIKMANEWMNNTLPSRKIHSERVPTILVMQRLHEDDPSGNMLAQKNRSVKHICLPADYTDYPVIPEVLKKYYREGLLDPARLTKKVLTTKREIHGNYGYSGQYGQQPTPLSGGMFQPDKITPAIPDKPFRDIVRFWDKAATEAGGAYSVGVKMGKDTLGRIWILDVVRGQWGTDRREGVIKSTAAMDTRKTRIGVENEGGSGGKDSALMTIRGLQGYLIVAYKPTGDKALRADPFSVQVNGGNVWMMPGDWNQAYVDEMRYFPVSKYKDQIDASSGAFKMLVEKRSGNLFKTTTPGRTPRRRR